jgi:hypothetical protein
MVKPTLRDRAVELYAENFMLMDLDNARAWLEGDELLMAFWMGIAECSVNAERRD